jgi:hypothetical protein
MATKAKGKKKSMASSNGRVTLALIGQKLDFVAGAVERIDNTVNGGEDKPGIKGRVTLLEDREQTRRWHFRTIWAAIVASGIGFFFKG